MLSKPISAKNPERTEYPKKHLVAGDVEDWFSIAVLGQFALTGVTVDFFVNWTNNTLSDEIWVKRIVYEEELVTTSKDFIQQQIYLCDTEQFVKDLAIVAKLMGTSLKYKLFRESTDWSNQKEEDHPILSIDINDEGEVEKVERVKLEELKSQIRELSGGSVRVGNKGLIYSTTRLEHFLSTTDAAWPGDVDFILLDNKKNPIAILEFKKHTLDTKIEENKFEKYYRNGKDKKKYDRLAILRDRLNVPLLVLYYPTKNELEYIILEEVIGPVNSLEAGEEWRLALPINVSMQENLVREILQMISE